MGFIKGFQQGYHDFGGHFAVAGREVVCSQCGGTVFDDRNALLSTRGLAFLELNWLNSGAALLVCRNCGHIEWFLGKPEELP